MKLSRGKYLPPDPKIMLMSLTDSSFSIFSLLKKNEESYLFNTLFNESPMPQFTIGSFLFLMYIKELKK